MEKLISTDHFRSGKSPRPTVGGEDEGGGVQRVLDVVLNGFLVAGEDGEEGGGELGEVVKHLQSHAHLARVLVRERKGGGDNVSTHPYDIAHTHM